MRIAKHFRLLFASLALAPAIVLAGVGPNDLVGAGMPPGLAGFAANVSSSEGNWDTFNQYNCVGAFQFCPGTLERYYSGGRSQFANDPKGQVNAWLRYQADEWSKAKSNGYTDLIGKEICYKGKCATVTASSILKACQFGCGTGGKLGHVASGGGCDDRQAKDGNLYSVCNYLISGAGHDVSDITGMTEEQLAELKAYDDPNSPDDGSGSGEGSDVPAAFLMPLTPFSGEPASPLMPGKVKSLGT